MPTLIKKFTFASPKTVSSGSSIKLSIEVTVDNSPCRLELVGPTGYTLTPANRTFDVGEHEAEISLIVSGPKGSCAVEGQLGQSKRLDVVEVQ